MTLSEPRPRWQVAAGALVVWTAATAVTGRLYGSYPVAALGTATGAGIFALVYATTQRHDFNDGREFLRWLVDIKLPTRRDGTVVAAVVLAGIASRLTLGTLQNLFAPAHETPAHTSVAPGVEPATGYVLGLFVFAAVVAPALEELLFRNGLQKLLALRWSARPAIGLTSLAFTLLHVPSYGGFGAPATSLALPLAVVFVDSTLYGWAYHRTGNVVVAMLAHGTMNALAVVAFAV